MGKGEQVYLFIETWRFLSRPILCWREAVCVMLTNKEKRKRVREIEVESEREKERKRERVA